MARSILSHTKAPASAEAARPQRSKGRKTPGKRTGPASAVAPCAVPGAAVQQPEGERVPCPTVTSSTTAATCGDIWACACPAIRSPADTGSTKIRRAA